MSALATAADAELPERAERLHSLATWLAAAAKAIELENASAAVLHVELATIIAECERITSAGRHSAAA